MHAFLFYPFALVAILGALGVITLSKPTHALLCLIVTMFALAVLFILLQAYFVAMVHLIVYAGAVLVLFLFVIMLLGIGAHEPKPWEYFQKGFVAVAVFVPAALMGLMSWLFARLKTPSQAVAGSPETFGTLLFTRYLLPFELVSFLLLIGVFAAVVLVSPPKEKS